MATGNLLKLPVATIEKEKEFITGRLSKCVQEQKEKDVSQVSKLYINLNLASVTIVNYL